MQRRRSGRLLKGATKPEQPKEKDENAVNIVSRLSRKYLINEKKTKQKEQLPPKRNLRNRSTGSIGSLSNSLNDSKQNSTGNDTNDLYDFDLSEESLSLKLFPDTLKNSNNNKTSITSYGKKHTLNGRNSKSQAAYKALSKSQVKNASSSNGKGKSNSSHKPEKKRPFWETFTNTKPKDTGRKRRKLNSESSSRKAKSVPKLPPKPVAALRRQATVSKTPNASSSSDQHSLDSGIFSSPSFILSPVPKSTSTPNDHGSHTTSTPSILLAPVPEIQLYEEPAYESLQEMQLFEEPAYESFVNPASEASSEGKASLESPRKSAKRSSESPIKYRIPLAEKNYANISFSGLTEREKLEKKKKKRESLSKSKGKYDKLADEINKQFEEFESYELSVDDEY